MTDFVERNSTLVQRLALAYCEKQEADRRAKNAESAFEIAKREVTRSTALPAGEALTCEILNSDDLITIKRENATQFSFTVSKRNLAPLPAIETAP